MSATLRPVLIPGAAACEALRARAQAALDAWAREWTIELSSDARVAPQVRVSAGLDESWTPGSDEWDAVRSEAGCVWFRRSSGDRARLGEAVVGAALLSASGYVDDWIAGIAERAWQTRNRTLAAALLGAVTGDESSASLSATLFAFGSGAVLLSCEELGLYAIADSGAWCSASPAARTPAQERGVTPLDRAMRQATARVDVMLGSVELELPKLLDLRRGDVLRLPQRLDSGIHVLCEGQPLAHALLGELQGRKCIQVLPTNNDEEES